MVQIGAALVIFSNLALHNVNIVIKLLFGAEILHLSDPKSSILHSFGGGLEVDIILIVHFVGLDRHSML